MLFLLLRWGLITAPRKLAVDPLSLTKEQKEKLSAPGPADCWGVGAKLWFSTNPRLRLLDCLMQYDAH